jgi:glutaredoxin
MADLLHELGVRFEFRSVSRDSAARREWEQLDGDRVPLLRLGNHSIVRGFDRIKVQQLFGWVGC